MIRRASQDDVKFIAALLTGSIMRDFSISEGERTRITALVEESLHPALFFVSESEGVILAAVAVTDGRERMIRVDAGAARRHFGAIMGTLIAHALKKEYQPLQGLSDRERYIDALVAEDPVAADALLGHLKKALPQVTLKAEVTDKNTAILAAFKRQGFIERARTPFTGVKDTGISERIALEYNGQL